MTQTRLPRPFPPATSLEATSAPKHHHVWGLLTGQKPWSLELSGGSRLWAAQGAGRSKVRGGA